MVMHVTETQVRLVVAVKKTSEAAKLYVSETAAVNMSEDRLMTGRRPKTQTKEVEPPSRGRKTEAPDRRRHTEMRLETDFCRVEAETTEKVTAWFMGRGGKAVHGGATAV